MMSSDSIIDIFNASVASALEIGRQLYANDAGLAQRLLLEARDNIDAILEDFNQEASRRSHMDHHSADHQDPPGGGGGGNHSQGGANQNIRQPGNLKDHNAYDDSRRPNVSADRGGVNTSGTVISANVTDSVTNGTNPQGITDNINRVLNSPGKHWYEPSWAGPRERSGMA